MARIRTVKPEFFTSVSVAELTRDARLAWIGLWTHVDDAGRCADEPRLIKAALFPLDDDMPAERVEQLLVELGATGRIVRYEVDGRRYLQVVGFREHQRIDKPKPTKLPPPPLPDDVTTVRGVFPDWSESHPGRVRDASSPDQDQDQDQDQGKDQDQDPRQTGPRTIDDLVDSVVERLVDMRTHGKGRKGQYRMTVRQNILKIELDDIRRAVVEAGSADPRRIAEHHEAHRPRYDVPPARSSPTGSLRALDVGTVVPLAAGGLP